MSYVEEFLQPLEGYSQYEVAKLALTTNMITSEIAKKLGITTVNVQKRINHACERLDLEGISRAYLRQGYIDFLERKIKELSKYA